MAKINPKLHLKIYIFIVVIMIICIAFLGSNLINKEILDSEVSKILNKNIITSNNMESMKQNISVIFIYSNFSFG